MRAIRVALKSIPLLVAMIFVVGVGVSMLGSYERTVTAPGEVRVREYHVVRPEVGGLVDAVHVASGDRVRSGQELVRLRDPAAERARLELEQELSEAQTRLESLRHQHRHLTELIHPLLLARESAAIGRGALQAEVRRLRVGELAIQLQATQELEVRARELSEAGVLSEQDLHAARFSRLEAEQRHRSAEVEEELERRRQRELHASLELARREQRLAIVRLEQEIEEVEIQRSRWRDELEALALLREKRRIAAPIAGVVVSVPARELLGRSAVPGEQLLMIVDVDSVYFLTWVSEQAIVRVRDGQAAQVDIAGLPRQRFKMFSGRVEKVAQDPTAFDDTGPRRYAVEIRLREPAIDLEDGRFVLRSGMRGNAKIAFQRRVPLLWAVYDFLRRS